ncbi:MAG: glycosyltransferase [Paracoccaceae bacterium]
MRDLELGRHKEKMTIRSLVTAGLLEGEAKTTSEQVTVAFALDSAYLPLFKVALASLANSGNFLDAPLAIYTNDAVVLSDPIVRRCADKMVLLDGKKKSVLESLAQENVRRAARGDWNRGTFLKWQVFEKQETDKLVFLDVDMIFLRAFEEELLNASDRPMSCCPQVIKKQFLDEETDQIDHKKAQEILTSAVEGHYWDRLLTNVNSGVMVVSGDLLSDEFFDDLTATAASRVELNEQLHITRYFQSNPDQLRMLPYGFNFQAEYLSVFDEKKERDVLADVGVLHFAGQNKPWKRKPKLNSSFGFALWHWHRSLAEKLLSEV